MITYITKIHTVICKSFHPCRNYVIRVDVFRNRRNYRFTCISWVEGTSKTYLTRTQVSHQVQQFVDYTIMSPLAIKPATLRSGKRCYDSLYLLLRYPYILSSANPLLTNLIIKWVMKLHSLYIIRKIHWSDLICKGRATVRCVNIHIPCKFNLRFTLLVICQLTVRRLSF